MQWEDICRYADQLLFRSLVKTQQAGRVMEGGIINGVDLNSSPESTSFQLRLNNVWFTGGYSRIRRGRFVLEADQPTLLSSEDGAGTPVEYVLYALAACLTTSLVYHAEARDINVDEVELKLEGNLDLLGFRGVSEDVHTGHHNNIRLTFRVKSDASAETLRELCRYSPVLNIVSNSVPVLVSFEKKS